VAIQSQTTRPFQRIPKILNEQGERPRMTIKRIGAVLWILVLIYGGYRIFGHLNRPQVVGDPPAAEIAGKDGAAFDGRVFAEDFPWKRLPQIDPFELTERSGQPFDSRSLAGKPYVVSFFFSRCPAVCRNLNQHIGRLANQYKESPLAFVGLSTDSKYDSPEVLAQYADSFECESDNWLLLTAGSKQHIITQLARNELATKVDGDGHHTSDLFLIDRWGRFRDRFSWDDPREMKRFDQVVAEVLAETEPPLNKSISTRNVAAAYSHEKKNKSPVPIPWLKDFQLTDKDGQLFFSRDLTGNVWVGSFFFSRCGTVCPKQNAFLAELQSEIFGRNAKLVSITTDPEFDTPQVLRPYAKSLNAGDAWHFLTGDSDYINRIGSEFLGILAHGPHHSSQLVVVDRWGNVRGRFQWQAEAQVAEMLKLIDQLNKEQQPVFDFEVVEPQSDDSAD